MAWLLSYAMRTLPVGTSYAIFTGIGAVGAIGLGVIIHKDPFVQCGAGARALAHHRRHRAGQGDESGVNGTIVGFLDSRIAAAV
ncbi:multidrug efflux SMR transporter [Nocardia sp. CC227C]|uniref:DMT family transporter n=1 Tax=Nocardia sp. CC227C TaxID=3044562 RepID=UPI00278BCD55|nr:SMR family transporter [Nocardia sp. CC227C]